MINIMAKYYAHYNDCSSHNYNQYLWVLTNYMG